jgi:hypothetical protein
MSNKGRSGRARLGNAHRSPQRRGNAQGVESRDSTTPEPLATSASPPAVSPTAPQVNRDPVAFAKAMPALVTPAADPPPPPKSMNGTNGTNGKTDSRSFDRPTLPDAPAVKAADKPVPPAPTSKPSLEQAARAAEPEPKAAAEPAPKAASERTSKASSETAKAANPDEISIPPVGDLEDEKFFAQGHAVERAPSQSDAGLELELGPDPKVEHKMRPEVRARRAKYTRYVQWTVGVAVLLCVLAVIQHRVAARGGLDATRVEPKPAVAAAAQEPTAQAVAAPPEPVAAALPAPPAQAEQQPAEPAKADPAAAAEPAAPPEKTALEEKRDARVALERSAFKKAIEAGERSVALDPADGEAWLVLGAAYQSTGRSGEARRCFSACLKQGKKGPLGECRAMLQ